MEVILYHDDGVASGRGWGEVGRDDGGNRRHYGTRDGHWIRVITDIWVYDVWCSQHGQHQGDGGEV